MQQQKIPEGYELQQWVCQGRDFLTGGKLGYGFQQVKDGKLVGEPFYYPSVKSVYPGGIYSIIAKPDQASAKFGTKQYVGEWEDKAAVMKWDAKDQATMIRHRAEQLEKKAAAHDTIGECIKPLAPIYQRTDSFGRRAIEALLLEALRKSVYGL